MIGIANKLFVLGGLPIPAYAGIMPTALEQAIELFRNLLSERGRASINNEQLVTVGKIRQFAILKTQQRKVRCLWQYWTTKQ